MTEFFTQFGTVEYVGLFENRRLAFVEFENRAGLNSVYHQINETGLF